MVRKALLTAVVIIYGGLLFSEAMYSLRWRVAQDPAMMLYAGYLMDEFHYVPYRDFFEQNMIGTYFLHALLVRFTGHNDVFLRLTDLLMLLIVLVNTFLLLNGAGKLFALFVSVLSGFGYFYFGQWITLQREIIILVLVTSSISVYLYVDRVPLKIMVISFLAGICITVKPHSGIMYPAFLFMLLKDERSKINRKTLLLAVLSAVCFLTPLAGMLFYLSGHEALSPFLDMASNYWKLYAHIDGALEYREGYGRLAYLVKELLKFGTHSLLLIPAYFGMKFCREKDRKVCTIIILFTVLYVVYPVFSGQFFDYHVYSSFYFLLVLAACSLRPLFTEKKLRRQAAVAQLCLAVMLSLYVIPKSFQNTVHGVVDNARVKRVDRFVDYLRREKVTKSTRVQPLDWVMGGAVNAMLITGVQPGTRFLQDFFFYHSVSHLYIQRLRKEFISELSQNRPDYIIEINPKFRVRVSGVDTSRKFRELDTLIGKYYSKDLVSDEFTIYKKKTSMGHSMGYEIESEISG